MNEGPFNASGSEASRKSQRRRGHPRETVRLLVVGCLSLAAIGMAVANARAHGFDYDSFNAQTTGAYVHGWVHWTSYSGGHGHVTIRDTSSDGHCARGYVRAVFNDGSASGWTYWGQACGYGAVYSDYFGPWNYSRPIWKLQIKAYRTGIGNSDIYSVSPGGL